MQRLHKGNSLFAFPQDYVVVDIETSGLSPQNCEIIEVSAIRFRNFEKQAVFTSFIKPSLPLSYFTKTLTGITDEMVKDAPPPKDVLASFYDFVGGDVIVGHNVNFDVDFLYDNLQKHNGLWLTNDFVDVLRLSRKALPQLKNHRQSDVANFFGTSICGAHRAERDCEICNENYVNVKNVLLTKGENLWNK